jgi:hypothetical protein
MSKSIPVKWNAPRKSYSFTTEAKQMFKKMKPNVVTSIKEQLTQATKFTREGLMDPVDVIEVADEGEALCK